jgi:ribosomal protein S11
MAFSKSIDVLLNNSINQKFKKLQHISYILQNKIYFLVIRSTLNNYYVTITNNFGKIVFLQSGGMLNLTSVKRNTSYNLELILLNLLKKADKLNINCFVLRLDLQTVKKKKIIIKILQKFQVKVVGVQLVMLKAFNGIRLKKRRRI